MATGIAPDVLADLDDWWINALFASVAHRWRPLEEMAAVQAELLHALLLAFVKVNSADNARLPAPLHIPRPGEDSRAREASTVEIFAFFGRGVNRG